MSTGKEDLAAIGLLADGLGKLSPSEISDAIWEAAYWKEISRWVRDNGYPICCIAEHSASVEVVVAGLFIGVGKTRSEALKAAAEWCRARRT